VYLIIWKLFIDPGLRKIEACKLQKPLLPFGIPDVRYVVADEVRKLIQNSLFPTHGDCSGLAYCGILIMATYLLWIIPTLGNFVQGYRSLNAKCGSAV
jgi:hypothetical protein